MSLQPGSHLEWGDTARQIKERDWLTRFSCARGPLCRWPGATVEQVEKRVRDDLALLRQVLRQNHGAVMLGQEQNAP